MGTQADRIQAKGATIQLGDGSTAQIRFGMLALKQLEEEFGSIAAMQKALTREFAVDESGAPSGKAIGIIFTLLKAGTLHLRLDEIALDEALSDGGNDFEVLSTAVFRALEEGLGSGNQGPKDHREKSPSRGKPSTTSLPSNSTEPKSSSGE